MKFNLIHPSIIDLYISALTLHMLEEHLEEIGEDKMDEKLSLEVDKAANHFAISARNAEKIFGSSEIVQDQLNAFTYHYQGET